MCERVAGPAAGGGRGPFPVTAAPVAPAEGVVAPAGFRADDPLLEQLLREEGMGLLGASHPCRQEATSRGLYGATGDFGLRFGKTQQAVQKRWREQLDPGIKWTMFDPRETEIVQRQ